MNGTIGLPVEEEFRELGGVESDIDDGGMIEALQTTLIDMDFDQPQGLRTCGVHEAVVYKVHTCTPMLALQPFQTAILVRDVETVVSKKRYLARSCSLQ